MVKNWLNETILNPATVFKIKNINFDRTKTRQNASLCSDETETEAAPAWNGVQRVPTRATEEDWEIVGKFEKKICSH